jgi:ribosomal protein L11 methyltransferase
MLLLYAPAAAAAAVVRAVRAALLAPERVAEPEPVEEVDWSQAWRTGLGVLSISPRLRVRPSFAEEPPAPGQAELVIDPGQAFGTGGHASTRLALEWVAELAPRLAPGARVLDVGTGSGVLALAALRLSEARAVGLDLDPLATEAAAENARRNGLAARLDLVRGSVAALAAAGFDLVLANLLRSEALPLLAGLAARTRPGGHAVFSGLLAGEGEEFRRALAAAGLHTQGERRQLDPSGESWLALLTAR